jgi:hypothetical protein
MFNCTGFSKTTPKAIFTTVISPDNEEGMNWN